MERRRVVDAVIVVDVVVVVVVLAVVLPLAHRHKLTSPW